MSGNIDERRPPSAPELAQFREIRRPGYPGPVTVNAPEPSRAVELTVVVPCYNECANVAPLVRLLDAALSGVAWEVVFVDDDSPDGTAAEARRVAQLDPRVRCIRRIGRRGLRIRCGRRRALLLGALGGRDGRRPATRREAPRRHAPRHAHRAVRPRGRQSLRGGRRRGRAVLGMAASVIRVGHSACTAPVADPVDRPDERLLYAAPAAVRAARSGNDGPRLQNPARSCTYRAQTVADHRGPGPVP